MNTSELENYQIVELYVENYARVIAPLYKKRGTRAGHRGGPLRSGHLTSSRLSDLESASPAHDMPSWCALRPTLRFLSNSFNKVKSIRKQES